MTEPIRVLVFGTTGTGKTSLCNALTGGSEKVSDAAQGVTFKSHTYEPVEFSDQKLLIITDTVGLNESTRGNIPSKDAVKALIKLLKDSKEGYNLLVHVFRQPRITQAEENNYEFFVKTITASKIPVILAVTGCENIEPMSKWGEDNADTFTRIGLEYNDVIGTCFAKGGRLATLFDDLRNESCQAVLKSIAVHATEESVLLYKSQNSIMAVLKKAWNWWFGWIGIESLVFELSKGLVELLVRIGFTREEATILLDELDVPPDQ
jgi:predicted GTPase